LLKLGLGFAVMRVKMTKEMEMECISESGASNPALWFFV
jgi:hypothetical protein